MADPADDAQKTIDRLLSNAIEKQAQNSASLNRGIHRHEDCTDCGDPISTYRQLAVPGTPYCAFCQGDREDG